MLERFTPEARAVISGGIARAHALRRDFLGCEHLLMALAEAETPAGETLREHGITSARVREVLGEQTPFEDLDREALAAVGVDLDRVREAIERTFGPEALNPVSQGGARRVRFTPRAKECLANAVREARASREAGQQRDRQPLEHRRCLARFRRAPIRAAP